MKDLKKVLACVMAVATLSTATSLVVSADFEDVTIGDSIVSKTAFGTVFEKNMMTVTGADFYEDSTVIHFYDGTDYTLPMCDDLIYSSLVSTVDETLNYIDENGNEASNHITENYYLIGYAVSYFHHYYNGTAYETWNWLDEVTLPNGQVLKTSMYDDVEAVYNLDGKYMGYRYKIGEDDFSDIFTTSDTTIGDSDNTQTVELNETPTGIRGDVNYDGEVNAVDLLLLKKYLLQIITW